MLIEKLAGNNNSNGSGGSNGRSGGGGRRSAIEDEDLLQEIVNIILRAAALKPINSGQAKHRFRKGHRNEERMKKELQALSDDSNTPWGKIEEIVNVLMSD